MRGRQAGQGQAGQEPVAEHLDHVGGVRDDGVDGLVHAARVTREEGDACESQVNTLQVKRCELHVTSWQ